MVNQQTKKKHMTELLHEVHGHHTLLYVYVEGQNNLTGEVARLDTPAVVPHLLFLWNVPGKICCNPSLAAGEEQPGDKKQTKKLSCHYATPWQILSCTQVKQKQNKKTFCIQTWLSMAAWMMIASYLRSKDTSVVECRNSGSKCWGFELQQEQWENFLHQDQLSVLTLILVFVPSPCYFARI